MKDSVSCKVNHGEDPFEPKVTRSPSLTEEQKWKVRAMLLEECARFMRNDDDINLIDGLEMKLDMHDETPVQTVPTRF